MATRASCPRCAPETAEGVASLRHVSTLAALPLLATGKVREMSDLGDRILMVASDRTATYDVVHPTPIPDKGKVLTALSVFWFEQSETLVPNHLVSIADGVPDEVRGRALAVRKLEMVPVECVVRGYITGSGWKDYQATGAVAGIALPPGLRESQQLPEPIFTPSTKADVGHDETMHFDQAAAIVGLAALGPAQRVEGRKAAAVVRQAVRARLGVGHRLGQEAARARDPRRRRRRDPRALRRGLREDHRRVVRRLARTGGGVVRAGV